MSDYLYNVTLDTGNVTTSSRSRISDAALQEIARHLDRAIEVGQDIIPTTTCTLKAVTAGRALLATILGIGNRPILTFGVCPSSRSSRKLWELLISERKFFVDVGEPPPPPWLAVRMEIGGLAGMELWMPDYEQCIAWAWLERTR